MPSENEQSPWVPETIPANQYDYLRYYAGVAIQELEPGDRVRVLLEGVVHEQDTKFRAPRWLP